MRAARHAAHGHVHAVFVEGGLLMERRSSYSVRQLAKYLGLAEVTIYKYVKDRKIPFTKIGKRVIFLDEQIQEWLKAKSMPAF